MIGEEHLSSEEHNRAPTLARPRVGRRPSASSSEEHRRISFQDGVIKSRRRHQQPLQVLHHSTMCPTLRRI